MHSEVLMRHLLHSNTGVYIIHSERRAFNLCKCIIATTTYLQLLLYRLLIGGDLVETTFVINNASGSQDTKLNWTSTYCNANNVNLLRIS